MVAKKIQKLKSWFFVKVNLDGVDFWRCLIREEIRNDFDIWNENRKLELSNLQHRKEEIEMR